MAEAAAAAPATQVEEPWPSPARAGTAPVPASVIVVFTVYVPGAPDQLRHSISIAGITLAPLAAVVAWFGLAPYVQSLSRVEARQALSPWMA